jgi:hypothetical protein
MDLKTLREKLLDQHRRLREQIERLLDAPVAAQQEELDFRAALASLSDDLAHHNREEEALLAAIVPTLDAWGTVRKQLMDDHHAGQHAAQLQALRALGDVRPFEPGVGAAVHLARRSLSEIVAHMEWEERELLHPDVLRDDVYAVDGDSE